jgi:uncharacterized protein YqhQ
MKKYIGGTMKKTSIGGQAVIEGVMMRGPEKIAVAVRKLDKEIVVDKKDYIGLSKKNKFLNVPIIRGVIAFFESLVIGTKTLMLSAEYFDIEDETPAEESKIDKFFEKIFGDKLQEAVITISVVISLIFGVGLFILLPNYIAGFLENVIKSTVLLNVVEGIIRILIFLIYVISVSKMKDIQRVFEYHGAEHKSISCYENGAELTVENVRKYSRLHPRCGTSFLLIVMVISILVFSFAGWGGIAARIISRLLLLPVVAGISYEIIKWAGRSETKLACAVSKPGMWFQLITTSEPDNEQIEVAISALKAVLVDDEEADLW